jgi:hypothetical protein
MSTAPAMSLATRTVKAYSSPDRYVELNENDVLDGGSVLPGFSLSLAELFSELSRVPPSGTSGA